jgi:hypothetical protein
MNDNPMHGSMSLHLNEGMGLDTRVNNSGRGVLTVGTWSDDGWELILFGSPTTLRKLAEALHELADRAELEVNRQRTLDNAPVKSRTKLVLEGEKATTIAA